MLVTSPQGRLRVIADVIDPDVIRKILDHTSKARPPPRASPLRTEKAHLDNDLFAKA